MKAFALGAVFALGMGTAYAADTAMPDMPGTSMPMIPPGPAVYMGETDKPGAPVFANLGTHTHQNSTKNARMQKLFDQGVNFLFGFNHAEAIRSFREGVRLDPHCAMCWWGIAFAYGSNILRRNLPPAKIHRSREVREADSRGPALHLHACRDLFAVRQPVYRNSLMVYRRDGWALYGLTMALKDQGKSAEAEVAQKEFDSAWQSADVQLASSRF